MKQRTLYECDICHKCYDSFIAALQCEEDHYRKEYDVEYTGTVRVSANSASEASEKVKEGLCCRGVKVLNVIEVVSE